MSIDKPQFHRQDVEIEQEEVVYDGFFRMKELRLRHRLFAGGWSGTISRELYLRHEAVGVLLYDPRRDLIGLVEQFRVGALEEPLGPWCMEVVAGIIDSQESPEQVALREVKEEAGLVPERVEYICNYLASPGGSNERLHLYCGYCDLDGAGGIYGLDHENEDIRLHVLPAAEVFENLYGGRFNNAATMICLQWLQVRREQ
ncbi:NUDIX domain-containing protein [Gilvimarinus sp. F26214L]|uniref:NUDIX domain-containing protein n=1 Tax=Gilvimarinus sp. DZF01 TaxID=3461371 RepID=UPI004045FD65